MGRKVPFLLHGLGLLSFGFSFQYIIARPNVINRGFGGHFQFLTNIALLLSTLAFTFGMLSDLIPSIALNRLRRIVRFIAMPLEVTITLSYWLVYFSNISLIVDQRASPRMPLCRDLGFHFLPTIFLLADYTVLPPKRALQMRTDFAVVVFGGALSLYWLWLATCYQRNGYWPYPILARIGPLVKAILIAATTVMMSGARFAVLRWSV
ncbi:hypothetical protein OIDMADRAFT_108474 [Oidiodendron maius Zn]|uniref:FAR-17a/AIG1-like protein n=1 Tax=Oidiodendron maius (strain Zn) TaxID=913774 RepID=A0A0C3HG56_OIDMZ|nr:hypothetical protein OIDMADRAFT_108474 [Oidiodendron maius Zn]